MEALNKNLHLCQLDFKGKVLREGGRVVIAIRLYRTGELLLETMQ
jgi:hypothetical protein